MEMEVDWNDPQSVQRWRDAKDLKREQAKREEVARLQATELMAQYDAMTAADEAVKAADKTASEAKTKFADMLAAALKITVGMRVSVTTTSSWSRKTSRTTVYEVVRWTHAGGANLTLRGNPVRKDGTLGEQHDISSDWKRVV